jgi:hypothetical protein
MTIIFMGKNKKKDHLVRNLKESLVKRRTEEIEIEEIRIFKKRELLNLMEILLCINIKNWIEFSNYEYIIELNL